MTSYYRTIADAYPSRIVYNSDQEAWLKSSVIPYAAFYYGDNSEYEQIVRNTPNFYVSQEVIDGKMRCSNNENCPLGSECISGSCQAQRCQIDSECSSFKCLNGVQYGLPYKCKVEPKYRGETSIFMGVGGRPKTRYEAVLKAFGKVSPDFGQLLENK